MNWACTDGKASLLTIVESLSSLDCRTRGGCSGTSRYFDRLKTKTTYKVSSINLPTFDTNVCLPTLLMPSDNFMD